MARTPSFNMMIVYDSLPAALRVKEMADRLAEDLRPNCALKCEFWKFSLLNHAGFRAGAEADALRADMIIVAANGHAEFAAEVKTWFETLLRAKGPGHCALVALLDEELTVPGQSPPLCASLQEICAAASQDFFCQAGGWRPAELQYVVESIHREPASAGDARFESAFLPEPAFREDNLQRGETSYREWGIND